MELFSYQEQAVERLIRLLSLRRVVVDMSSTGVGKTYVAVAIAARLRRSVLICCPKAVKSQWGKICDDNRVDAIITNYEELRYKERYKQLRLLPTTLVIFDEAHKAGGRNTQNGQMLAYFYAQGFQLLLLSATLAVSPLRFNEIGRVLGLYRTSSEHWRWMVAHGVRKGLWGGLQFSDPRGLYMRDIHEQLLPNCGIRVTTEDIPEFPRNYVYTRLMDADLTHTQVKAVNESWAILEALRDHQDFTANSSKQSNRMIQYHSQMAFLEGIRLHLYPDIILPLIDEGKSVVVFLRYRSSLDALNALIQPTKTKTKTSFILGGQTEKVRNEQIAAFQANTHPLCLCMLPAGGVGLSLHDLHGRQRYSLLSPTFDATQFKQALGRINRIGSRSKSVQAIIYLANTREEQIATAMQDRLKSLDLLNDGVTNKLSITDMELD